MMGAQSSFIHSKKAREITILATSGHFATAHSHINYYVDLTDVKSRHKMARQAAAILARSYVSTGIDTIICQEGTEMIGAFMADELSRPDLMALNAGANICVITPELCSENQLVFRENTLRMVRDNNILLLMSTISTGKTAEHAINCISYYGGHLAGISALFSIIPEIRGIAVNTIFTDADIAGYQAYPPDNCKLCDEHYPIIALVNAFGYSKL